MTFPRSSGILLHPTSLPGRFGIGDLGPEAYRFVDFLAAAGQRIWQVLPLGPTGYGDSPYQLFSAFAGNPAADQSRPPGRRGPAHRARNWRARPNFQPTRWIIGRVIRFKLPHAARRLRALQDECGRTATTSPISAVAATAWLPDYALFMAVKEAHGGEAVWSRWEPEIAARKPAAMQAWRARLAEEIAALEFAQYMFVPAVAQPAPLRARTGRPHHGRPAHLRGPRQRRRVGESGSVPVGCGRRPGGHVGRAAGLFQRHRPVVGQSDLPLGPHGGDRLPLVDRPAARGA